MWKTSPIVEACLVKKFDRLPPGVAAALKTNATFVDEDGPMREAVLAASPLTKEELLKSSPGAVGLATKVCMQSMFCCFVVCFQRNYVCDCSWHGTPKSKNSCFVGH